MTLSSRPFCSCDGRQAGLWYLPARWRYTTQRLAHPLPTKGSGSLKRWVQRTPAMAAGITDHIWTTDELLSFRVPPRCVWPSTPHRQHGNVPHERDTTI
jgi:hypothetical protein